MDELHALAVGVARRILESGDADPGAVELARSLLEEVGRRTLIPPPRPGGMLGGPDCARDAGTGS